jgi:predicted flap endonuclease-1-like 5' DNA nuclease
MIQQQDFRHRAADLRRTARAQLKEIRRARLARQGDRSAEEPDPELATADDPGPVTEAEAGAGADAPELTQVAVAQSFPLIAEPEAPEDPEIAHPPTATEGAGMASASSGQTSTPPQTPQIDAVERTALAEIDDAIDAEPAVDGVEVVQEPPEPDVLEPEVAAPLPPAQIDAENPELPDAPASDTSTEGAEDDASDTGDFTINMPDPVAEVSPDATEAATGPAEPPVTQLPETEPEAAENVPEDSDLNSLPGAGPGLVWMLHQCGVGSLDDLATSDPADLSSKLGVVGQILDVGKWIDFAKAKTGLDG